MPRADEPRVMVRLSAGLAADLDGWAVRHGVKVPAIMREAVLLVGERAAVRAAERRRVESSVGSGKVRPAAPVRSRPAGAASSVPLPEDRAAFFRAAEERRQALRR